MSMKILETLNFPLKEIYSSISNTRKEGRKFHYINDIENAAC